MDNAHWLGRAKKRPVVLLAALLAALLLGGCVGAGLSDWSYPLPNGYAIVHVNSQQIIFGRQRTEHSTAIDVDSFVYAFCYSARYVGLQRLEARPADDAAPSPDAVEYYLADTQEGTLLGPMTEREYAETLRARQIDELCGWIKTVPAPDGAKY